MSRNILFLLLLGLSCISAPLVAADKNMMSLKQLVETRHVSSVAVSPNGKFSAYTMTVPRTAYEEKDGKHYEELHVVEQNGKSRKFIIGKVAVYNVQWDSSSKFIYYQAKRNDDKFTSIYRIAIDGGESEKIVTAKNNISGYSISHDSTKLVYIAKPADPKAKKTLKEKGFKAKIYEESVKKSGAYLVDLQDLKKKHQKINIKEHIRSVAFSPVSNELLMRVTPTALIDDNYVASQFRIYSLKGKRLKAFKTEGKLTIGRWSNDGKNIAMIGAENKNDPAAGRLYVGNVRTQKVTEPVQNYMGHVKDIEWLSDYQLAYLGHLGTKSEVGIINIDNGSVTQKVSEGNFVLKGLSTDKSGKVINAVASTSDIPREVVDISSGKVKRLTNSNAWLSEIKMPKQETITHKARDGVELQGVFIYPTNYKKGKRYPMIMMVHGGPESHVSDEWLDKYSYPIKHAAANGFAVFLPNYRGSTGRGVEFSKMGQADYAGAEFNDLVDAITHLSDKGLIDKKKVGITGGSYGGYASAWGATALSEHFAASVMFVGISNQLSKFGTTDIPKEMYNVHARNYPWDKWQWMLERSPIYHTDKAKTPILIMHGEQDTRVHPSQSMELYRYIKTRTDTPARLVFYPGEPHGNKKTAAQLDYAMRLMRWMTFYLKGNPEQGEMPPYEIDHAGQLSKDSGK